MCTCVCVSVCVCVCVCVCACVCVCVCAGLPTGGATGAFFPGPSLKGAPGGPIKGPLDICLKDRYTLIEQSDLDTLIEQYKLINKEI